MTQELDCKVTERTKHDELFKGLISAFPYQFLELFFPWFATLLEKGSLKPIATELIDPEDLSSLHADLVFEGRFKDCEEIIIHFEGQNQRVVNYNRKIYTYNFRLQEKHYPKKVISFVVFGHNFSMVEPGSYNVEVKGFQMLNFNYLRVQLNKLDWQQFRCCLNPIAAAILSKVDYRALDRVAVKIAHMQILAKLDLSEAEIRLVMVYFDTYLTLSEEEKTLFNTQFQNKLSKQEVRKMTTFLTSYHEDGIKIGRREGIQEGAREIAKKLMRIGKLTFEEIKEVTGLSSEEFDHLAIS